MYTCPIEMKDVRYNAASQCFEGTVTVHDNRTQRSYACAIQAPLTMPFESAARGLSKQAIRLHQQRGGLFSEISNSQPTRHTRRPTLGPRRLLRELLNLPQREAA